MCVYTVCVFSLKKKSLLICNNMHVEYVKPWENSPNIRLLSCRHCSALGGLKISSIMQHRALLVGIKDSLLYFRNKPAVNLFVSHSVLKLWSYCTLAAGTKILSCKWHHVHFHFTLSPQERVTSTACKQMFHWGWKGKCSATLFLFQMWNCSDFNKQVSNWGFRPREVQSLIW